MKPLGKKKTVDGIWFLVLIIYVYTFDTCFNLLRCVETEMHTNDFHQVQSGPLVSSTMPNFLPYAVICAAGLFL